MCNKNGKTYLKLKKYKKILITLINIILATFFSKINIFFSNSDLFSGRPADRDDLLLGAVRGRDAGGSFLFFEKKPLSPGTRSHKRVKVERPLKKIKHSAAPGQEFRRTIINIYAPCDKLTPYMGKERAANNTILSFWDLYSSFSGSLRNDSCHISFLLTRGKRIKEKKKRKNRWSNYGRPLRGFGYYQEICKGQEGLLKQPQVNYNYNHVSDIPTSIHLSILIVYKIFCFRYFKIDLQVSWGYKEFSKCW